VSWLITINEKILAGARPYVDVVEVNPPASIWLYTPAVWLAEVLRIRSEAVVASFFIAGALLSIALTLRIIAGLRQPPHPVVLVAISAFVELILPLGTFAQREHAAILFAVPALAALAVLAEGHSRSLAREIMAGFAAGAVIALKPHFGLAIMPAIAFAAWRLRAVKPLIPFAAAAVAVVAAYAAAVLMFTPDYLKLLPLLADVYLPLRERWTILIGGPVGVVPLALCALAFALRPRRVEALPAMLLMASLGFAVAGLIQGKGYLNHALPGMALGFVGLVLFATEAVVERQRRNLVLVGAAVLAAFELYAMGCIRPDAKLTAAVARVAPPRPSIITLGPDLLTGHPLVRNIGGHWAGSRAGLFIAAGAHPQLATASGPARARLMRWYEGDIDAFAHDVERERPDVMLVDTREDFAFLRHEPKIQQAIAAYRPRARSGDVEIWVRR
jgi:hypothetical protein